MKPASADWQPIATLGQAEDEGLLTFDSDLLLWNPCDGPHMIWAHHYGIARIESEGIQGVWTHWALGPEAPSAAKPLSDRHAVGE
jgi:hypothetical protein